MCSSAKPSPDASLLATLSLLQVSNLTNEIDHPYADTTDRAPE